MCHYINNIRHIPSFPKDSKPFFSLMSYWGHGLVNFWWVLLLCREYSWYQFSVIPRIPLGFLRAGGLLPLCKEYSQHQFNVILKIPPAVFLERGRFYPTAGIRAGVFYDLLAGNSTNQIHAISKDVFQRCLNKQNA